LPGKEATEEFDPSSEREIKINSLPKPRDITSSPSGILRSAGLTCGVCQLTTHVKCYYRLGSDEAAHYETHVSDWRCQDCNGPQRHADCVLSNDEQVIQRHAGPRPSCSGGEGGAAGAAASDRSLIPRPQTTNDMLIDQNLSDPLISLSPEDYPMDTQSTPMDALAPHLIASNHTDMTSNTTKKRRTKTKKPGSRNHGGHSTQHRKKVQKQGSGSLQK